jgi:hypothetical protein
MRVEMQTNKQQKAAVSVQHTEFCVYALICDLVLTFLLFHGLFFSVPFKYA